MDAFVLVTMEINLERSETSSEDLWYDIAAKRSSLKLDG